MALVLLSGRSVLRATIHRPRVGIWHADLEVDSASAVSGPAKISIGDGKLELEGVASRVGVTHDLLQIRVIGGAGGFTKPIEPQYWFKVPVRVPLAAILTAAGERLATSADASVLAAELGSWTLARGECGQALAALMRRVPDATWRMTASGAVWVGIETWPAVTLDHIVTNEDKAQKWLELASDDPTLTAGVTLDGRKISNVVHRYEPGFVRTEAWYE